MKQTLGRRLVGAGHHAGWRCSLFAPQHELSASCIEPSGVRTGSVAARSARPPRSYRVRHRRSELWTSGGAAWTITISRRRGTCNSPTPAVISWGSKKQVSVALSSCEAEIMAASEAAKEAVFLSRFLDELGHSSKDPIELGMDNKAAIAISYNPELHARTL